MHRMRGWGAVLGPFVVASRANSARAVRIIVRTFCLGCDCFHDFGSYFVSRNSGTPDFRRRSITHEVADLPRC